MKRIMTFYAGLFLCLMLSMPYNLMAEEDFSCGTTITSFPYSESFESGLGNWSNTAANNLWNRHSGSTTSTSTGPSSAYQGTYYMYVESSYSIGSPNKVAALEGPCFDLGSAQSANFEFAYHMYGSSMGTLSLEVSLDNGTTWQAIWSRSGDFRNEWFEANIPLDAFVGQTVKLRFYGVTGSSFRSDMAIDNLNLTINSSSPALSCTSPVSTFPYSESFTGGLNTWDHVVSQTFWSTGSGSTPTPNTGPGSSSGFYLFLESDGNNDETGILESPCFDLTQLSQAAFQFDYHMYGSTMGTLKLQIQTESNSTWETIWSRIGDHGNQWFTTEVDLGAYVGQKIKLRFRGVVGSGNYSDMAVDEVSLTATAVQVSAGCNSTISTFPYSESFESSFGGWTDQSPVAEWQRNMGSTPDFETGPTSAHAGSYYVFVEGGTFTPSSIDAFLTGPCFDLSGAVDANFNFHYHMYSSAEPTGSLSVEISTNNGASWNSIWNRQDDPGNYWNAADVDLSAYTGQLIQLRFHIQQNHNDLDIAIDNLHLYAPLSPLSGNLQGTVEYPQTTTCTDPDLAYCCDAETLTAQSVSNVGINISSTNGIVMNTYTDGIAGQFAAIVPGGPVDIEPFVNASDWNNGLSTTDIIAIQRHVLDVKPINCPLRRIAADIDSDGDIDSDDVSTLQNLVTNTITSVPGSQNWKFIPKATSMPSDIHPDIRFLADFWNPASEDNSGDQYPFKAKLNLADGSEYTCAGANSWLNKLETTLNTNCITTDYGFYIVKTGDMNESADYSNFSDPYGPPARPNPNQVRVAQMNEPLNQSLLRSSGNKKYEVRIVVDALEPIIAYQMGIRFDDELMNLGKIKPNREYLQQTEAKNFGQARKGLRGGQLITSWLGDLENEPLGKALNNTITIMSFEFQSKADLEAISSAFHIDSAIKEIQFFNKDGELVNVDLQVFVEAVK